MKPPAFSVLLRLNPLAHSVHEDAVRFSCGFLSAARPVVDAFSNQNPTLN